MSGLSLVAYEPIPQASGLYARDFIDDITENHERGQFTTAAVGGYDNSSFILKGTRDYLNDWFDDGLMRRVVWYNPQAVTIWEGFVSRMRYSFSDTQKTKAIDGYYNRVYMVYSPLGLSRFLAPLGQPPATTNPPVIMIVDDTYQQGIWGIKSAVISGGERTNDAAYDWSRTVLKERAEIPKGETINTAQTGSASIEVECWGYYHTLKWIPYIKRSYATVQAHQVIQEVLEYFNAINPGWISTDFENVQYNYRTSPQGFDSMLSCWDVIVNIIKEGGAGGERWVGGLYQDRKVVYKPAESLDGIYGDSEFQLWRQIEDPNKAIYEVDTGNEVKPWDMLPDRILHTVDL